MEQAFRVEIKDYLQLNTFLVNKNPRLRFIRIARRALMPTIAAGVCYFDQIQIWFAVPIVAVVAVIWYLLQINALRRMFKTAYAADMAGACTIAIAPEGFRFQNTDYAISVRWEKLSEVTESKQHLIFLLSSLRAFVIPKSAFPDEEHARAFLETALAYQAGTLSEDVQSPETTAWPPPPHRMDRSNRAG